MIDHECMVCGGLMTDGWDICVNCLADSFGATGKKGDEDMRCEVCGKETSGTWSEGGAKWSMCEDCMTRCFAQDSTESIGRYDTVGDHHNRELRERYEPEDNDDDGEE